MRVLSALMFFPRGGSAHVGRALATGLPDHGWDVTMPALAATLARTLDEVARR